MTDTFAKELWDQFDEVYRKVSVGKEFTAGVADFVHKRAALEKDYARKLQALCKASEKESGTTLQAWMSLKEETENISKKHSEFGEALLFQVEEPLLNFLRDNKKPRQALHENGKKVIRELQSAESKATSAKTSFEQAKKKLDDTNEEYERTALNNQQSPAVEKIAKKVKAETKKSTTADKKYSEAVDACRGLQDRYYDEDMPRILKEFQSMEQIRLDKLRLAFTTYMELQSGVAPEMVSSCERMRVHINNIDTSADLQSFINEKRTGKVHPERIVYESYSSDLQRCVKQETSGSGGSSHVSSPVTVSAPVAVSSTPAPQASRGAPAPASGVRGVSMCRGLFDYQATDPNELSFKQGDIITVLQKDPSGWWQGELNGKIGVFPSVDWVEELPGDGSVPTPSTPGVRKCRVMFEYAAEAPEELSILPGDIITVDRDEDGWFCGTNQRGGFGRYPSNYVELI